jgi:hypothetical protein
MAILRYIGIVPEVTFGTDPTSGYVYTNLAEGSVSQANNMQESRGSQHDVVHMEHGNYGCTGSLNGVADTDMIGVFLEAILGNVDSAQINSGTTYQHTFWPINAGWDSGENDTIPSHTLHYGHQTSKLEKILGAVFSSVEFSVEPGGMMEMSANFTAQKLTTGGSFDAAAALTSGAYVFTGPMETSSSIGADSFDGTDTGKLKGATIRINGTLTDDDYVLGSRLINQLQLVERSVEGSLTIDFNQEEFKRFFGGDGAQTAPVVLMPDLPLILKFSLTDPDSKVLSIAFCMPRVAYENINYTQRGQDVVTLTCDFKAMSNLLVDPSGHDFSAQFDEAAPGTATDGSDFLGVLLVVLKNKKTSY